MARIRLEMLVLFTALICAIFMWYQSRNIQPSWPNVPPVASEFQNKALFMGDGELAFRAQSLVLQNLGDHGGRGHGLGEYDYERLSGWFDVLTRLNPVSDYIPILAGYYFGAVKDPARLRIVISYLRDIGNSVDGRKWRWLAQAMFLARYDLKDQELALEIANELAAVKRDDLPGWTRQMPVLIMSDLGRKDAALALMLRLIADYGDKMHPNEVNFMKDFVCTRILSPVEWGAYPFCFNGEGYR